MSLQSWKREFYPEDAGAFYKRPGRTPRGALEHSLRKWRGTLPENLARHGVQYVTAAGDYSRGIADDLAAFRFSSLNCALCERSSGVFFRNRSNEGKICQVCPLRDCSEAWQWAGRGDTAPMIALLEGALEELDKDNQED